MRCKNPVPKLSPVVLSLSLTLLSFPSHLLCLDYCMLYFLVRLFVDLHPLESKVLVGKDGICLWPQP